MIASTFLQFRACLLVALASCAFAGFASPFYGYTAPVYSSALAVAPAVTSVHHGATVSKVSHVDRYSTLHPVATPVARYATVHTAPAVATVHTVPAVAKLHHTVPAYGYGYGLGAYGLRYGHGLKAYGYGLGYHL